LPSSDGQIEKKRDGNDGPNHSLSSYINLLPTKSKMSYKENEKSGREREHENGTKVLHREETIDIIKHVHLGCKNNLKVYCDKNGPSLLINTSIFKEMYTILRNKGVTIKIITEITPENIESCRLIIGLFKTKVKNLQGIKGNFALLDDKIYLATSTLKGDDPIPELIYSNAEEIVEQNKYLFDTLWKNAKPAEQIIREISEGLLPVETFIVDEPNEILDYTIDFVKNVERGLSNCTSIGYFKALEQNKPLFDVYLDLLFRFKKGMVRDGVRWITYIEDNKEHLDLIKNFLNIGIKIKHTSRLPPLNFAISEKQFVGIIEKIADGKMFQKILHSSEPLYLDHFHSIFEELWSNGVEADLRIRQIQTGTASEMSRIIEDSIEAKKLLLHLMKNAKKEILAVYPSSKAVDIQKEIGALDILVKKSQENILIKILSPKNVNLDKLTSLDQSEETDGILESIIVREILGQQEFKPTILMIDRKHVLAMELRDNKKSNFEEATGLTTYSTSHPTVVSYISIFESLWEQIDMSIGLSMANEKLMQTEQMERDFINTAAHELRTPTQAVMGYAELGNEVFDELVKNSKVIEDDELRRIISYLQKHFEAIYRNSVRLEDLINNLLDVSRIESTLVNSLSLHIEKLDLVREIKESVENQFDQKIKSKNIEITFINDSFNEQCWVDADKSRLNQIIHNLIGNAIKFTNQNGSIDVIIKDNVLNSKGTDTGKTDSMTANNKNDIQKKKEDKKVIEEIFISISDTGKGIPPQIESKLFNKFVTTSETGTGLGLYIARNLVEAHGGRIWAFNNNDGVGSTFIFSLPKADDSVFGSDYPIRG
jgi:signal transduction histidine kinase